RHQLDVEPLASELVDDRPCKVVSLHGTGWVVGKQYQGFVRRPSKSSSRRLAVVRPEDGQVDAARDHHARNLPAEFLGHDNDAVGEAPNETAQTALKPCAEHVAPVQGD